MQVEYEVESCNQATEADDPCIDSKRTSLALPTGGYLVYGVAHQHSGGLGANLYGEVILKCTCLLSSLYISLLLGHMEILG